MDTTQETVTLPRIPNPKTEWGKRTTYCRYISDWSTLPNFFKETYALQNF